MPRKSKDKDSEHISGDVIAEISDQPITDTVRTNFMPYAMYVIRERSIPEIDGFKPSHRKLLYISSEPQYRIQPSYASLLF